MKGTLIGSGNAAVVTVHPSGIIDIRIVDDTDRCTMTHRMNINTFAEIARVVFMNVRNDLDNFEDERDLADTVNGKIMNFIQTWVKHHGE